MSKVEREIENLVTEPINKIGYEVYDVTYRKEGQNNYLTIFIDNDKGISLDDCEKVNNEINDLLDETDIIKEQYFLEISSPGIERVLRKDKHFENNIGSNIYVKTFSKIKDLNVKEIEGTLKEFDTESITLEVEDKKIIILRKDIALARKIYEI